MEEGSVTSDTRCHATGFEDGGWGRKSSSVALEGENDKAPLEPQRELRHADTLVSAQ